MVSYVVLAIPALYLIHMYKLKWALVVGSCLNTIGCIVRVCGNLFVGQGQGGFAFAFLGAAICSCAQLFTLAIPPSLSMTWFPASERALATGVGVFANQMVRVRTLKKNHSTNQLTIEHRVLRWVWVSRRKS